MTYTYEYPRAAITTDAVIFNLKSNETLQILLIQRKNDPFREKWALPGGFLDIDETLEQCVEREVEEETGLRGIKFYQLHAFSDPHRDPRHRTITVAFWGFCKKQSRVRPSSDALSAAWFDIDSLPHLAFDHESIIKKALKRALEIIAE